MSIFRSQFLRTGFTGLLLVLFHLQVSSAQTPSWLAPLGGYVYDPLRHTVRPISGFVGSAVLGPVVATGVQWISLAPNQHSALLQQDRKQMWVADLSNTTQAIALPQIPAAREALWAADSSRVVLLANAQIVWLTNLDTAPAAESSWNLVGPVALSRHGTTSVWSLLAADPAADKVLLSAQTPQGYQLWEASSTTAPVQVSVFAKPFLAAFASTSAAAFVADPASHQVLRVSLSGTASVSPIFSSAAYLGDPSGMALSSDGARLFLADPSARAIHVLDATSGAFLEDLPTSLPVGSFTPVASGRVLLNSDSRTPQPFWFLDTGLPAKVSFVPRGE